MFVYEQLVLHTSYRGICNGILEECIYFNPVVYKKVQFCQPKNAYFLILIPFECNLHTMVEYFKA